ncbi:MAG TPA: acetate kinase [Burkholderiales bacterium]|nr:acetate kinase [Burkholderiales bacterium]
MIEKLEQQSRVLAHQQKRLAEQEKRLQEYKEALERALALQGLRLEDLETQRGTGMQATGAAASSAQQSKIDSLAGDPEEAKKKRAGPTVIAQTKPEPGTQTPQKPTGQAPESANRPPEIAQITEYPGVLTPAGKIVLEPALQYSYASNNRVALAGFTIAPAIVIGEINIENLNRQLFVASLTARYGLTSRFEVEMKIPYVYRQDSTTARPLLEQSSIDQAFNASGNGLGDIEFTARAQLNKGEPDTPYFVGSLRFKTTTGTGPFDVPTTSPIPGVFVQSQLPTGTGFYALQPGITALYASDPAVLFGGASYVWNIGRNNVTTEGGVSIGSYDPGDGVTLNFGLGLSLNERTSFSVGYEHDVFFKDKQNGQYILNAQNQTLGTLLIGYSYRLSKSTTFNLSLGIGVTPDAPDTTIWVRLPVVF